MDNGVDNPFRPGSELSKEADIIVNLIKEGKPITPTKETAELPSIASNGTNSANATNGANGLNGGINEMNGKKEMSALEKSPDMNGTPKSGAATVVEVQHGIVVPPNDGKQVVEEINIKKRRKCCAIQWTVNCRRIAIEHTIDWSRDSARYSIPG